MTKHEARSIQLVREILHPPTPATPAEATMIRDVQDAAVEWDNGNMPLEVVDALNNARKRAMAVRFTPPGHVAFAPLMRLFDALIARHCAAEGMIHTKHGFIEKEMMTEAEVLLRYDDGRRMVVFPERYPWLERPNRDGSSVGVRDTAIYPEPLERAITHGTSSLGHQPNRLTRDVATPWWEDAEAAT